MIPLVPAVVALVAAGAFLMSANEGGTAKKMPPWLLSQYQAAKANAASRPADLSRVADLLDKNGFHSEAEELRALARTRAVADSSKASPIERAVADAITSIAHIQSQTPVKPTAPPPPAKAPVVKAPAPAKAPAVVEAPSGAFTLNAQQKLAKRLADHLNALVLASGGVARAKGKEDKSLVMTFQTENGLKVDGSWGQKSAKLMATLWGDVPIVFYWPKNSQPGTVVPAYRSDLELIAMAADKGNDYDQMRAKMIRLAAQREKGQGFGSGTVVSSSGSGMTAAEAARLQQQVSAAYFS